MPTLDPELSLDLFRSIIVEKYPELEDAQFSLLTEGWDSVAVDVDDTLIFKFPRGAEAEEALAMEAGLLGVIRSAISTPVPDLELFSEPRMFSRHLKLKGEHLLTEDYELLEDAERQHLAKAMAAFFAQLHVLDATAMTAAGAAPLDGWPDADYIRERALPVLPPEQRDLAERTIAAWEALPTDPLGTVYGFFDGHGWNMAFDHEHNRLNGIYDFADSGFGPLQHEFVYPSLVSADLTARIIAEYEALTGRSIDRDRVNLLTGILHLVEVAWEIDDPELLPILLGFYANWAARQPN
jgi:aminoglycoside phosphotransferase (APT) family kinase protein